jgi:flagella synthesis protein FlgN
MDKRDCAQRLGEIFSRETEQTRILLDTLVKERESIHKSSRDTAAIEKYAGDKQQLIDKLALLDKDKNRLLAQCNFENSRAGIEGCIQWCDSGTRLMQQWQQLLQLLTECRNANTTNGIIIESTQRSVRHALSILYGQPQQNNAYTATGKEDGNNLSRTIGQA